MKMKLVLLTFLVSVTTAFDAGITAALDFATITQAKDVYFSIIIEALNAAGIPDIEFKGGYIHGNTFHVDTKSSDVTILPTD